jgi:hypothetical protein
MYLRMKIKDNAKRILRQAPALMTEAEAITIAKRQLAAFDKRIKALKKR